MQFCSQMVNYDLPCNPMKIEQRIGRIHRIGQEKEVQIYNFCAAGSIEDYILDILDRKTNMFEMVIGEIDMILGRISGEKEFSDMVCDIWLNSKTTEERDASFAGLGTKMKKAKAGYEKNRYPMQFQSPLLERITTLAGAKPTFLQADLKFDYIKTEGFDRLITEAFDRNKTKVRITGTGVARTRYFILTNLYQAQSDEPKEGWRQAFQGPGFRSG